MIFVRSGQTDVSPRLVPLPHYVVQSHRSRKPVYFSPHVGFLSHNRHKPPVPGTKHWSYVCSSVFTIRNLLVWSMNEARCLFQRIGVTEHGWQLFSWSLQEDYPRRSDHFCFFVCSPRGLTSWSTGATHASPEWFSSANSSGYAVLFQQKHNGTLHFGIETRNIDWNIEHTRFSRWMLPIFT